MVDRRRFVTAAAATLVAAGVPGVLAPPAHAALPRLSKWWKDRLNSQAELQGDSWHLAEVVGVDEFLPTAQLDQFTVLFRVSVDDHVAEGIYTVIVNGRKRTLFLQPAGGDETGNYCIAAVSRLLQ